MKLKLLLSLALLNTIGSTNAEVKLTPEVQAFLNRTSQAAQTLANNASQTAQTLANNASQIFQEGLDKASQTGQKIAKAVRTRIEAALPVPTAVAQDAQLANKETGSKFQTALSFIKNNKTAFAISATLAVVTYVLYKHRQAAPKTADELEQNQPEVN